MTNNNILDEYTINYTLFKNISDDILYRYNIFPIEQNTLYILIATNLISQDTNPIMDIFKQAVKFIEVPKQFIEYEIQNRHFKTVLHDHALNAVKNIENKNNNSYILDFLDQLLIYSITNKISDIHIEAVQNSMIIRLRLDGMLNQIFRFDISLYKSLSSIIKYLGNLDISISRLPLDSRFSRVFNKKEYDFRISTIPTVYGESIVLRILDNENIYKNINDIGFEQDSLNLIKKSLNLTQGIILVTGPTGSGKTTTLYSMLNHINCKSRKIITVEDPVEYKLNGIIQVNIDNDISLDFKTVLKNILRQDPDILMIGEIRDKNSLQIAMQAALTGHLVIATLHTNNCLDTITRLLDLEAPPYLIASTLKLVLSQRLLRVLCPYCKIFDEQSKTYKETGCSKCNLTGFQNRHIVSELLNIDQNIKHLISNQDINAIHEYTQTNNFISMGQNGYKMVQLGITSLKEYYSKVSYEI